MSHKRLVAKKRYERATARAMKKLAERFDRRREPGPKRDMYGLELCAEAPGQPEAM